MTKHFACMLSKKMHDRPDLLKQDISSWIAGTGTHLPKMTFRESGMSKLPGNSLLNG
jgi:hypothetical protein